MRVLWITNIPLADYMMVVHGKSSFFGGWLDGLNSAIKLCSKKEKIDIYFCSLDNQSRVVEINKKPYYSFTSHDCSNIKKSIIELKPDVVHIFGTEYKHTLLATDILNSLGIPFITSIQGLISVYARHYRYGLPEFIMPTFHDIVKLDLIGQQAKKFKMRGKYEINALQKTTNIIGRTDWDNVCTKLINPQRRYYKCNEVLRSEFYDGAKWSLDKCEKHSIFISQISYPIKGFHTFIEALSYLKNEYSDLKVYVTGTDIINSTGFKNRLKQTSYSRYLRRLIIKNHLENNIIFLGPLKAEEMKKRYLRSHVSVSCSVLENSSNSIAEAGILGVPTVATLVGGGSDMVVHGQTGLLYNILEPYMAYHYIDSIFKDDDLARRLSSSSVKFYKEKCSPRANGKRLIEIYEECLKLGSDKE